MKTGSREYYSWKKSVYYNDLGRFDICQECPLKIVLLQKHPLNNHSLTIKN